MSDSAFFENSSRQSLIMKLFDHNSSTKHEIIKPIELASITLDFQMLEDVSMELKHVFVFVIKK